MEISCSCSLYFTIFLMTTIPTEPTTTVESTTPVEPTIEERATSYEERFRLLFLVCDRELDIESLFALRSEGLFDLPDEIVSGIEAVEALYPEFRGTEEDIEKLPELDLKVPELEDLLIEYDDEISDRAYEYFFQSAFLEVSFAGGSQPDHVYFLVTCGGPDIRIRVYVDAIDPIEVQNADIRHATWGHSEKAPFDKELAERMVDMACPEGILRLKFASWGGTKESWDNASA